MAAEGEEEEFEEESTRKFLFFNVVPSWMVSFIAHIALIVLLALWFMPSPKERTVALEAGEDNSEQVDEFELDLTEMDLEETLEEEVEPMESQEIVTEPVSIEVEELADIGTVFAPETFEMESMEFSPSDVSNETSGRTGSGRDEGLAKNGGSSGSEDAVSLALKWIADHQLEDGGWNFDHRIGPGSHRTSPNAGELKEARMGATAMALLPFLGRGETHMQGEYQENVERGLKFLIENAKARGDGFSYNEGGGSMYSHGLVAIVFGEAYAMTKDPALKIYARGTLNYIQIAQDPVGGGWRYSERQAGDTSAVGWQIMALKSGKMGGLTVNKRTYQLAEKFLESVSTEYGAYYGYLTAPPRGERGNRSLNSVGLLCRMYMGWDKNHPGLTTGIKYLSEKGPDANSGQGVNMYYNYYATQAMKHYGGDEWKKWNGVMREFLVESQSKEGPTAGSWYFEGGGHGTTQGGRLYATSLACMTLEVYYRYLPLYSKDVAKDEFPLD